MSKQEVLQKLVEGLKASIPDLRGVVIASTDGLPIADSLPPGMDSARVAAMTATAIGLGKRISETLSAGVITETSVTAKEGQIFIYTAGPKGVLAVMAPASTNVGLIHLEARSTAREIAAVM